jgi:hypothetical protein
VAKRLGPFAAFSRSAQLTAGRRLGILGLSLLIGIAMAAVLVLGISWLALLLRDPEAPVKWVMRTAQKSAIAFVITMGAFQMFNGIVQAVAYALLRQDKDGVSHEELAKVFE